MEALEVWWLSHGMPASEGKAVMIMNYSAIFCGSLISRPSVFMASACCLELAGPFS